MTGTPEWEANQRAIERRRKEAARKLTAPPGPAQAVKDAWAALRECLDDRRAGGGGL